MKQLKYVPVFRSRQQENIVLKSFDFGDQIYPCIEIIKAIERKPSGPRKNSKKKYVPKPAKTFEEVYFPLIDNIRAKRIFIDLPVHLRENKNMKSECLAFLRGVVANQQTRTAHIKKFKKYGDKIIPVISSYFPRTGLGGSIESQEKDLRKDFNDLAFRIPTDSFARDIVPVNKVIRQGDFLMVDFGETQLDKTNADHHEIIDRLKTISCTVIIHKSPVLKDSMNKDLDHEEEITDFVNDHKQHYKSFGGDCFSDYAGIKKDNIPKGGAISPGFIFFDAVDDKYYGYRGVVNQLETFETIIVPAVMQSGATRRMQAATPTYLNASNLGWQMIRLIHAGRDSGKNAAKFKRISMEHYLSCIKLDIDRVSLSSFF